MNDKQNLVDELFHEPPKVNVEPVIKTNVPSREEIRHAHRVAMDERERSVLNEQGKLIAGYIFWLAFVGLLAFLISLG